MLDSWNQLPESWVEEFATKKEGILMSKGSLEPVQPKHGKIQEEIYAWKGPGKTWYIWVSWDWDWTTCAENRKWKNTKGFPIVLYIFEEWL